jgi:ABC-type multidrug transport system fused ATPase/permease subunit
LDPFAQDSFVLNKLLPRYRKAPTWRFRRRQNQVDFVFELYNTTLKNFMFSWKYTAGSRKLLALTITCQIISALLSILAPAIGARIIIAYTNKEPEGVMLIAVTLFCVQLLRNLFLVISNKGYNHVYTRTLSALEKDLVSNVLHIESRCVDEKGSGLFIQRITSDTGRIATGLNNIADMVTQVLNYFGVLCAMFMVNPMIALFVVVIMGSQCAMELWRTNRLSADDRVYRSANERFSGLVSEMVRGAKDVKLLRC